MCIWCNLLETGLHMQKTCISLYQQSSVPVCLHLKKISIVTWGNEPINAKCQTRFTICWICSYNWKHENMWCKCQLCMEIIFNKQDSQYVVVLVIAEAFLSARCENDATVVHYSARRFTSLSFVGFHGLFCFYNLEWEVHGFTALAQHLQLHLPKNKK